jgi:hypothetical protein
MCCLLRTVVGEQVCCRKPGHGVPPVALQICQWFFDEGKCQPIGRGGRAGWGKPSLRPVFVVWLPGADV